MIDLILVNQSQVRVARNYLKNWLLFVRKQLIQEKVIDKKDRRGLSVVFLTETQAKQMNFQFRKKNYATDILSFESGDPDSFGDLAVCCLVAKKQSREHGLSFRDELAYMLLHGWLHLLGYEHEQGGAEAKAMYTLQDKIFEKIDKFRSLNR